MNTEAEIPFFQCDNIGRRIPCRYGDAAVGQIIGTRKRQEDACAGGSVQFHDGSIQDVVILADGMGGHNDGNAASKTVIGAFIEALRGMVARMTPPVPDELYAMQRSMLKDALAYADKKLGEQKLAGRIANDAGCTFMACMIDQSGVFSHISVGDSLMYRRAGETGAPVELINELHTVENREHKKWKEVNDGSSWASWQEQWLHDHGSASKRFWKALTQAVKGEHELKPHVKSNILQRGAILALTSDGVLTFGGPDRLSSLFRSEADAGSRALVVRILGDIHNIVNKTGKKQDNSTMVCYRFGVEAPPVAIAADETTDAAYSDRPNAAPTVRRSAATTARHAASTEPLPPASTQHKSNTVSLICGILGGLAILVISVGLISMYLEVGSAPPVAQTDEVTPPPTSANTTPKKSENKVPVEQVDTSQPPIEAGNNERFASYREAESREAQVNEPNADISELRGVVEQQKEQIATLQKELAEAKNLILQPLFDRVNKLACPSSEADKAVVKNNKENIENFKKNLEGFKSLRIKDLGDKMPELQHELSKLEETINELPAEKNNNSKKVAGEQVVKPAVESNDSATAKSNDANVKSDSNHNGGNNLSNNGGTVASENQNLSMQDFITKYESKITIVDVNEYNDNARKQCLEEFEANLKLNEKGAKAKGGMRHYVAAYDKYKNEKDKKNYRAYMYLVAADVCLKMMNDPVNSLKNNEGWQQFTEELNKIKNILCCKDNGVSLDFYKYEIRKFAPQRYIVSHKISHIDKIGIILDQENVAQDLFFLNTAMEMEKEAEQNVR